MEQPPAPRAADSGGIYTRTIKNISSHPPVPHAPWLGGGSQPSLRREQLLWMPRILTPAFGDSEKHQHKLVFPHCCATEYTGCLLPWEIFFGGMGMAQPSCWPFQGQGSHQSPVFQTQNGMGGKMCQLFASPGDKLVYTETLTWERGWAESRRGAGSWKIKKKNK